MEFNDKGKSNNTVKMSYGERRPGGMEQRRDLIKLIIMIAAQRAMLKTRLRSGRSFRPEFLFFSLSAEIDLLDADELEFAFENAYSYGRLKSEKKELFLTISAVRWKPRGPVDASRPGPDKISRNPAKQRCM